MHQKEARRLLSDMLSDLRDLEDATDAQVDLTVSLHVLVAENRALNTREIADDTAAIERMIAAGELPQETLPAYTTTARQALSRLNRNAALFRKQVSAHGQGATVDRLNRARVDGNEIWDALWVALDAPAGDEVGLVGATLTRAREQRPRRRGTTALRGGSDDPGLADRPQAPVGRGWGSGWSRFRRKGGAP
jgi:hypothetical protein